MNSMCPSCIIYIHDTLLRCLPAHHPSKEYIRFDRLQHTERMRLAKSLLGMLNNYKSHHNLALRLLRESRLVNGSPYEISLSIFDKILSWYKYMEFGKKQTKHPIAAELDFLAVEAVAGGFIQTRQQEDPLEVFKKWYLDLYFSLLEHLEDVHREHATKVVDILVVEQSDDLYG